MGETTQVPESFMLSSLQTLMSTESFSMADSGPLVSVIPLPLSVFAFHLSPPLLTCNDPGLLQQLQSQSQEPREQQYDEDLNEKEGERLLNRIYRASPAPDIFALL